MNYLKIDETTKKEFKPGVKVRFVHSDNMTFAHWSIEPGAGIPEHAHPHEQVVNVISGECDFVVDGETKRLEPGDVVIIPPDTVHAAKSVTDCRIIDVFYPVREDYR
jgi:quercetin dioxygenase-like cupin family protein